MLSIKKAVESKHFTLFIALAGFVFQLFLLFISRHNTIFFDEADYEDLGLSLWRNHSFSISGGSSAFRPPLQPLMIAGIYSIFGQYRVLVKLVQIALLFSLPFLCARLSPLLGLNSTCMATAVFLSAFHPALAYAATTLYPTVLTTVLLTAGIVWCSIAETAGKLSQYVKASIAFTLAGAATTTFLPLPILVGIYLLVRKNFRFAVIMILMGTLSASAWLVRNREVMGSWRVATNGGLNLYLGANDAANPRSGNWVDGTPFYRGRNELQQDDNYRLKGTSWIRQHRVRYLKLCAERALVVFDSLGKPKTKGIHSGLAAHVLAFAMLPFVVLGFAGLIILSPKPASIFTMLVVVLVFLSSAVTIVKPRFRFPCDPILSTFAVAGVSKLRQRYIQNSLGREMPSKQMALGAEFSAPPAEYFLTENGNA